MGPILDDFLTNNCH